MMMIMTNGDDEEMKCLSAPLDFSLPFISSFLHSFGTVPQNPKRLPINRKQYPRIYKLHSAVLQLQSLVHACNVMQMQVTLPILRNKQRQAAAAAIMFMVNGVDIIMKRRSCFRTSTSTAGIFTVARRYFANTGSSVSAAENSNTDTVSGVRGLDLDWYDKYRRSLYGGLTYKALLVDAVGTLLIPSQPAAQIYRDIGLKYGVKYSEEEILRRYRWAYQQPWVNTALRFKDDARPFWRFVVQTATGCSDAQYFEELYKYYASDEAWHLSDPEASKTFEALRKAGVKLALVSNFDTRLRTLLQALKCENWFDALIVSAEVEAEKPNPSIFLKACDLLDVKPEDAVHVGDDRRNDVWGARDAGCDAWLWGSDVHSFNEVAQRIGVDI